MRPRIYEMIDPFEKKNVTTCPVGNLKELFMD
jgi:hypothetical protein